MKRSPEILQYELLESQSKRKMDHISRFFLYVKKNESGCWEWLGAMRGSDRYEKYGRFKIKNRDYSAHRISFLIAYGTVPPALVCHSCDNRKCVNPEHLFISDNEGNSKDMVEKGRSFRPIGILAGAAKLNDSAVREIRRILSETNGGDQLRIASKFGVSQMAISKINQRKTWRHI